MTQAWMRLILNHWGQAMTLRTAEGEKPCKAFLQPVTKQGECVPTGVTALGWEDERQWLYLGFDKVSRGDTILWDGQAFRVTSGRAYYIGEELNHWWALLEPAKEAAS